MPTFTELVRLARLAFADALHLRRVQRIQLAAVLRTLAPDPLSLLQPDLHLVEGGCIEGVQLPPDIPGHSAQQCALARNARRIRLNRRACACRPAFLARPEASRS
ncbi:hypothetical protein CSC75_18890 [Pseudoxanthomonas wuyuanensis]|nr:hypothetical protein CSC75_18890 [Pseudoxanthomonas wuyuanensis]